MDIKVMGLHKSSTFSNFGNHKIGNWFSTLGRSKRKTNLLKISKSLSVVHEDPKIGSDGESEEASGASDEVVSPVKLRSRHRRVSEQDISKRLSLPADVVLPENFLSNQMVSPLLEGPISRTLRRQSLSEIGFGRTESYSKLNKLGEGTYATVYRGWSRLTDNPVALKEIRLEHEEGAPCTAIREVSLLKDLKHNNIVTLHDIIHTEKCLTLVFEYVELDLKTYLDEQGSYNKNVKVFLFQLLRGLAYCHRRKVLHRDLKPQNLLINRKGELKLADFGLARAKSVPTKTYSNEVVTLWYRPPEVLLGSTDYSTSIDLWGVGCIFFEMCSTMPLFPGASVNDQLDRIFKTLGFPSEDNWAGVDALEDFKRFTKKKDEEKLQWDNLRADIENKLGATCTYKEYTSERKDFKYELQMLGPAGKDLLLKLLTYDPKKRISAFEGTKHSYFESLGPEVHQLPDTASIFSIPTIVFNPWGLSKVNNV